MTSAIRARREAEDGFTLIELLVVVIIIGILAAIAIPAFLNQRERAWQAELTSAVRNTALDIEAEATALGGSYPATGAGQTAVDTFLPTVQPTGNPLSITYTSADTNQFQLCGTTTRIDTANRVRYLGGTLGNGIQPFEETAC